ncbi:hypothetical protein PUN28_003477 [Cardiocondyla obscurior]|uniref:Uncharacterized protein n=1 Tax=Cardiocondyla obscurior TaxID=286306 RepID=A0AAW2GL05_9HYME
MHLVTFKDRYIFRFFNILHVILTGNNFNNRGFINKKIFAEQRLININNYMSNKVYHFAINYLSLRSSCELNNSRRSVGLPRIYLTHQFDCFVEIY